MLDNKIKALEFLIHQIADIPELKDAKKVEISMGNGEQDPSDPMADPDQDQDSDEPMPSLKNALSMASKDDDDSDEMKKMSLMKGMKGAL